MKKYFVFGSRATQALWDEDLDGVVGAIDDLEAELFVYDPTITEIHEVLEAHSKWSDYAYLTKEQYDSIMEKV